MYRFTQPLPGGVTTLAGIVALSFLIPGWAAGALGWNATNAALVDWIFRQDGIVWAALLLLYGLLGFGLLLAAAIVVYGTGLALLRGLIEVTEWALRASLALARLMGEALYWPIQIPAETVREAYAKLAAYLGEQHALRRLYRQDYAADFPTYRAFARYWRALSAGGPAREPDPLQQAIRLMGLPGNFSRDDLKQRFRTLIAGIHPDRVGPNELATQLIAAEELIRKRKSWR